MTSVAREQAVQRTLSLAAPVILTDADQLRVHAPALRECAELVAARMSP